MIFKKAIDSYDPMIPLLDIYTNYVNLKRYNSYVHCRAIYNSQIWMSPTTMDERTNT